MTATRQAYAMASHPASASAAAAPSPPAFIAASASGVTSVMRRRAEWNVNRSGAWRSRRRNSSGSSVSIVVFELGTISPIR